MARVPEIYITYGKQYGVTFSKLMTWTDFRDSISSISQKIAEANNG